MEKQGSGAAIRFAITDSLLGRMLVARTETGLCAVAFSDSDQELEEELRHRYPEASIHVAEEGLPEEVGLLRAQLVPEPPACTPEFDLAGTAFERRVWAAMGEIPRGTTVEYGQFAAGLGMPQAPRAVGAAIGKNPIAVLFPCHRLVAKGGALHRYRWGLERKRRLLELEGHQQPVTSGEQLSFVMGG